MGNDTYSIPDHWDPSGQITASSDPAAEYDTWLDHAQASDDWTGDEFTLTDFRDYIESLQS